MIGVAPPLLVILVAVPLTLVTPEAVAAMVIVSASVLVSVILLPSASLTLSVLLSLPVSLRLTPPATVSAEIPYVVLVSVIVVAITPLVIVMPVPALKCALTSVALGPVYVNTPVVLLYDKLPSPPESVTLTAALDNASVY